MFGKFAVALLIVTTPALAADPAPADQGDGTQSEAPKRAYKTKKVCRSVEIVGSSIPRTTCTTRRVPVEPKDGEAKASSDQTEPESDT